MEITREIARELIMNTNGRIFSVQFEKKDGSIRDMVCRLGVGKFLRGGKSTTDHLDHLITVCEISKDQYRNINLNTLVKLKTGGVEYTIEQEEEYA